MYPEKYRGSMTLGGKEIVGCDTPQSMPRKVASCSDDYLRSNWDVIHACALLISDIQGKYVTVPGIDIIRLIRASSRICGEGLGLKEAKDIYDVAKSLL